MTDTDTYTAADVDADYALPGDGTEARQAQEAESDRRLDTLVRESAKEIFSRPDHDALPTNGATIDDTLREIASRHHA